MFANSPCCHARVTTGRLRTASRSTPRAARARCATGPRCRPGSPGARRNGSDSSTVATSTARISAASAMVRNRPISSPEPGEVMSRLSTCRAACRVGVDNFAAPSPGSGDDGCGASAPADERKQRWHVDPTVASAARCDSIRASSSASCSSPARRRACGRSSRASTTPSSRLRRARDDHPRQPRSSADDLAVESVRLGASVDALPRAVRDPGRRARRRPAPSQAGELVPSRRSTTPIAPVSPPSSCRVAGRCRRGLGRRLDVSTSGRRHDSSAGGFEPPVVLVGGRRGRRRSLEREGMVESGGASVELLVPARRSPRCSRRSPRAMRSTSCPLASAAS